MALGGPNGRPLSLGASVLAGVSVGTVVVLLVLLTVVPTFAVALGLPRTGSVPSLGCGAGQCVNISITFRGATSLAPTVLRLSVTPTDPTVIVNGSAGRPLNLTFVESGFPHWVGVFAGGTTSPTPFAGEIVDPSGEIVGEGASTILSGATLCLKGSLSTTEEFRLTLDYQGTTVGVLFAVD